MNPKFLLATTEDIPTILILMEKFYAIDRYPFDKETAERCLREFIGQQNLGRIWILKLEERIIGYFVVTFGYSFEYKGRDAFGDEGFIEEAYRHKGFGKMAADFLLQELKKEKISALHLEVEKHNPAKRLYSRFGFKDSGRILMTRWL
jgi:diamine N-acetyltransferase